MHEIKSFPFQSLSSLCICSLFLYRHIVQVTCYYMTSYIHYEGVLLYGRDLENVLEVEIVKLCTLLNSNKAYSLKDAVSSMRLGPVSGDYPAKKVRDRA